MPSNDFSSEKSYYCEKCQNICEDNVNLCPTCGHNRIMEWASPAQGPEKTRNEPQFDSIAEESQPDYSFSASSNEVTKLNAMALSALPYATWVYIFFEAIKNSAQVHPFHEFAIFLFFCTLLINIYFYRYFDFSVSNFQNAKPSADKSNSKEWVRRLQSVDLTFTLIWLNVLCVIPGWVIYCGSLLLSQPNQGDWAGALAVGFFVYYGLGLSLVLFVIWLVVAGVGITLELRKQWKLSARSEYLAKQGNFGSVIAILNLWMSILALPVCYVVALFFVASRHN